MEEEKRKRMIGRRYEGKVAIITASTQGIGFGIAERIGLEGASVVVSSRKQKKSNEKKTLLERFETTEDMAAAAAAFLASNHASYITGETLVVAGGMPSIL